MRNGKKGTVFVDVIQLMDSPERVSSAFVWLKLIDSFYRLRSHSLYFSSLFDFVLGHGLRDREFNSPTGDSTWAANQDKLMRKVIEGGPQIVDNIASDRNCVKGERGNLPNIWKPPHKGYGMGRDIRILNSNDYSRMFEGKNLGCEITEVLLGPLDLYANQNNSVAWL